MSNYNNEELPAESEMIPEENEMVQQEGSSEIQQYDDYEELPEQAGAPNNELGLMVAENLDRLNTGLSLAQNVANTYAQCLELREKRKTEEAMSKVEMAKTIAKYQVSKQFITETFSERREALSHDYKVLDDAIAKGDREMIIAAMSKIGDIVTSSPLKDLEALCKRFDDPDDSLLDF